MTTGQYAAVSAMAAMQAAQHAIANNFANVNTPGYKQDIPETEKFNDILVALTQARQGIGTVDESTGTAGQTTGGTELLPMLLDLTPGPLRATGRALDIALAAPGFMVLQSAEGTLLYSRSGSLRLSADRTLTDQFGLPVLDVNGAVITLPEAEFTINFDGTISSEGATVPQLAIVDLPASEAWRKVGSNRFEPANPAAVPVQVDDPQVRQRFLEQSNVDPMSQYTEMLSVMRVFEASVSLFQLLDQTQRTTASDIGVV